MSCRRLANGNLFYDFGVFQKFLGLTFAPSKQAARDLSPHIYGKFATEPNRKGGDAQNARDRERP